MLFDVGDSHKWTYLKNLEKKLHYLCIKHLVTQYRSALVTSTLIKLFVKIFLKSSKKLNSNNTKIVKENKESIKIFNLDMEYSN